MCGFHTLDTHGFLAKFYNSRNRQIPSRTPWYLMYMRPQRSKSRRERPYRAPPPTHRSGNFRHEASSVQKCQREISFMPQRHHLGRNANHMNHRDDIDNDEQPPSSRRLGSVKPVAAPSAQTQRTKTTTIVQQNVQTLTAEKKEALVSLMEKDKIDICLLQETKHSSEIFDIDGHRFFMYGEQKEKRAGVAIALSPRAMNAWREAGRREPVQIKCAGAARIMGLHLTFQDQAQKKVRVFVVSAHLPHSNYSDADYQDCLEEIDGLLRKLDGDIVPFIGADLNARVGIRDDHDSLSQQALGPYGVKGCNNRGKTIARALASMDLCSASSFFKHHQHWTWITIKDRMPLQLDYALMLQRDFKRVKKCIVLDWGVNSDHRAVYSELKLIARMPRRKGSLGTRPTKRPDWRKLKQCGKTWMEYNEKISEGFATIDDSDPDAISRIYDAIHEASQILPPRPPKEKAWFATNEKELLKLLHEQNAARHKMMMDKTDESAERFKECRRIARKAIKTAKMDWIQQEVDLLHKMNMNPVSAWEAMYRLIAGFTGHHKKAKEMVNMIMADGSTAKSDEENAQAIQDHFQKEVFDRASVFDQQAINDLHQREVDTELGGLPTIEEFERAVKRAKPRKAPGENGIPAEAYKNMTEDNLLFLHEKLLQLWKDPSYIPPGWRVCVLKLLPKKGDLRLPKNWRPISLLDVLMKIMSSIIATRLDKYLSEKVGIQEQSGFSSGRGCADCTMSLKIVLQNLSAVGQETFVLFVDLVKAFDSVNRDMLWQILAKFGVPESLIGVIREMYTDVQIKCDVNGVVFTFALKSGVKQGDNLVVAIYY